MLKVATIVILVLIFLVVFLTAKQSFTEPTYQIWALSKDPIWFAFNGDRRSLPRGYTEKDMILSGVLVTDSWN